MARQRLLLAYENPDCLKIYGSVLEFAGYDVSLADSGDQAFARLAGSAFDLLITDLYLGSVDDHCFVRRVRRQAGWAYLPIIVLTGWSTARDRRLALEEGADLFLPMPLGPRQLLQAVRDLLGPGEESASGLPQRSGGDQAAAPTTAP